MSESSIPSTVAIIGAGNVGAALAATFGRAGVAVRLGLRAGKDAGELLARLGERASAHPIEEAVAGGEVVFLAVPGSAALQAARSLGDVGGRVLVDCTNPLTWSEGPVWAPPPEGSNAQAIQAALPDARVVKAFNTFGAELHAEPAIAGAGADVHIAGDDAAARAAVSALARAAGFTPLDCGPLRNAAVLENLAMLWIHLATVGGQGRQIAFRLVRR